MRKHPLSDLLPLSQGFVGSFLLGFVGSLSFSSIPGLSLARHSFVIECISHLCIRCISHLFQSYFPSVQIIFPTSSCLSNAVWAPPVSDLSRAGSVFPGKATCAVPSILAFSTSYFKLHLSGVNIDLLWAFCYVDILSTSVLLAFSHPTITSVRTHRWSKLSPFFKF